MKRLAGLTLIGAFCACAAPRPVLYPNEHYNDVGAGQAKADADDCMAKAREYVKTHKSEIVARHTTWSAVTGAALGVVTGAFSGNIARGVAEGAALGGTLGAAHGTAVAASPDEVQKHFVDICLTQKGYQPIGWH